MSVWGTVSGVAQDVGDAADGAVDAVGGLAEDTGDAIGGAVDAVGGVAQDTGAAIGGAFGGFGGMALNTGAAVGGVFDSAKDWADENIDADVGYENGTLSGGVWLGVAGVEGSVDVDPFDGNVGIETGVSAGYGDDRVGAGITQEFGVTTPGQFGLDQGVYVESGENARWEQGVTLNADWQDGQVGLDAGSYVEDTSQYGTLRTEVGVSVNLDGSSGQGGVDAGLFAESYGDTFFGHTDERSEFGADVNADSSGGFDAGLFAEGPETRWESGFHFGEAGGESWGVGVYDETTRGDEELREDLGIGQTGPYAESEWTEAPAEDLVSAITESPAEPVILIEEPLLPPDLVHDAPDAAAVDSGTFDLDSPTEDLGLGDWSPPVESDSPTTLIVWVDDPDPDSVIIDEEFTWQAQLPDPEVLE